jgi:Ni,Fe-hydrogenase I large subunit
MVTSDKFFEKIDTALKDKKSSELSIIYAGIFIIIATIVYLYVFPVSEQMLKQTKNQLQAMKTKIAKEKSYIRSKTVAGDKFFYVKKVKAKIKQTKEKLSSMIFANGYIDTKLRELSYLLYNDVNWANFIDDITKNAKKYRVNINFIKNRFNELNYKKVEQALDVEVDANGNFNNLIKFINSIEESNLVVDVHELTMDIKKTIHVNFKIAVWGIKY